MTPSSQPNDLVATQQLLRATLDSSTDMIQVFEAVRNQQGQIIDFVWLLNNHASERIYGDVVGKRLLVLQPGVVEEGIFDAFKQVVETGLPQQYEKHYVHEQFDGWFHQSVVKLNDGVATTTNNITRRKQAEEARKQSLTFLQSIIDSSLDVIQVFKAVRDTAGTIVDFTWILNNQSAIKQNGDVIGQSLLQHSPGVWQTGLFDKFVQVTQTGISIDHQQYYSYEQFQQQWFDQTLVKMGDGFMMTTKDITHRKKAEEEIRRLNEAIAQRAEEKYAAIFNAISEGFSLLDIQFDAQGKAYDVIIRDANPAQQRIDGLQALIGRRVREVLPDIELKWIERYGAIAQTGEADSFEDWSEANQRWYRVSASRVGAAGSTLVAIVYDDITVRKRHEQRKEFMLTLSDTLRSVTNPAAIQAVSTRLLRAHFDSARSYYMEIDEENHRAYMRAENRRDATPSAIGVYDLQLFDGVIATIRTGKPLIVNDWDERTKADMQIGSQGTDAMNQRQIVAQITAPIIKQGHLVATLTVNDNRSRAWTEDDVELVVETAERTWVAVERANSEEALQASQQRFASIANLVPDLLWASDPDGATSWLNQRWLEYTGQCLEDAMGWGWTDAIHPDDRAGSAQRYGQAVAAGQPLQQEHRIRRHDGAYRWFVVHASPLKDQSGRVIKMYGAATDIHEKKLVEETLRQREEQLRLITDAMPALIAYIDRGLRYRFANKYYEHWFGRTPQTIIGKHLSEFLGEAALEQLRPHAEGALAGQPQSFEEEVPFLEGGTRYVSSQFVPDVSADGRVVGYYSLVIDITDRKRAEAALQESEKRLRLAIEATELATWEWNLSTNEVYWNEQHFRLFGMEPHPNPLSPDDFMRHVHPSEQQRIKGLLERAIAERGVYDAEFCAVLEDGSTRWMSGYGRITEEQNGQPVRMSGVMFDVNERRRAEDALHLADRRKDEFLAMLAHELRNPMSTIRSGLAVLALSLTDELTRSTVTMMNRQTDHLVRMVDDLLDVSRISGGKIELKKERIDLVAIVSQAVESVGALYEEQGRKLQLDLPAAPIYLEGDATRLTQVVANLLTNGARYTGKDGQVWVSLRPNMDLSGRPQAILQVRDNGIGLREDQRSAIFELFVQVDNSLARSKGGLGLGLTLVKRLVELHGGSVEAQSEGIDKGSTFRVSLPTLANDTASEATTGPQAATAPPVTNRILVIDDNADAAMMLGMLLKLKGYQAHTRTSGRAGIEAAKELQPRAILLDIGMPDLDGYITCQLIREQPWGRNMIVIALTGYGQEEDRQHTQQAGFDGHLVKPVDIGELMAMLTSLLDKKQ